MKLTEIHDAVIRSAYGKIDSSVLDGIIMSAMKTYNMPLDGFDDLKDLVVDDYQDSDISQVTVQDVVEIADASGFGEPEYEMSDEEKEQKTYIDDFKTFTRKKQLQIIKQDPALARILGLRKWVKPDIAGQFR